MQAWQCFFYIALQLYEAASHVYSRGFETYDSAAGSHQQNLRYRRGHLGNIRGSQLLDSEIEIGQGFQIYGLYDSQVDFQILYLS